ncbi:MAG: CDGSH iron-sulfur domain-containing protein [Frankiales bacterium]|nr:CDGSH iron-sulfur domain-containing protein [Frankiales bacterium]
MNDNAPRRTVVTAGDNGSFQVSGDFDVVDAEGNAFPHEDGNDVWLCRCGHSGNKPFCDGSHKKAGFQAVERATVAGDVAAPSGE